MDSSALMAAARSGPHLALWLLLLLSSPCALRAADMPGGIGLAVVPTAAGELVVLQVADKSPAAAAGLRGGDFIVQVNDYPLRGSDFAEVAMRRLRGDIGTPVTLKFLRPGVAGVHTVTLKRAPLDGQGNERAGGSVSVPARQ